MMYNNYRVQFNFSKMIRQFPDENNHQSDLNVGHHGWAKKKVFHSRSAKRAL